MTRQTIASGTEWENEVSYSRAVRVGDRIEVSGTTATDENGEIVGDGDAYMQARQAIANVESALAEADSTLDDVVRTRLFVTDVGDYEAVGRAHSEAFDDVRPATSMYEVSALVDPKLLVEIEASVIVEE